MPRILVVEDHPMIRSSISEDLALEGYEVLVAEDGGEGVEIARSKAPDLILMDMELRDVHGWEATRRLKANPETEAIPIIALTGYTESDEQEEIMKAGCDDFEPKPINHPRLLDKIKALLEVKVRRAISDEQTGQAGGGYGYTSEANRVRRTSPDVLRYEAGMLTSAIIEHSRTLLNEVADHGSKKPCSYLGIHSEGKQLLALVNDVLSPTARVADSKPDDLRHDLRSLITGILSCSRLLEKQAKGSRQSEVTFRRQDIPSASDRSIPLIDQVVNFSRVEAGEKVPRSQASNT